METKLIKIKDSNDIQDACLLYTSLLHVKQPIVIVECGFLSNWKEAAALNSEEYQNRLAWTIHMGIMQYLNSQ